MAKLKYKTQDGYRPLPAMVVRKTNAENGNGIGTCSTSSGTALTVSLTGYELVQNGFVAVTFEYDVPASATLNINGKGAKPIYYKGAAITADTIKADDTVMFCFDGTNYVVTSIGGQTGDDGEIVVVRCSADDDASVAGKTVTINGTQYTLDDTGVVSAKVPFGTQYSVVAGSWTGYFPPSTQSFTASLVLREVNVIWMYSDDTVDLGLPSGIKWRKMNLGATNPEDRGLYFSWGNITGHEYNSGYQFTDANYNTTPGSLLTANIPSGSEAYDAATAILGRRFRMPTKTEVSELEDYTDHEAATINGMNGIKFMKKTDHSVYIFMPVAGTYANGNIITAGYGDYWSSTYTNSTTAERLLFNSAQVFSHSGADTRRNGLTIRPVKQ